MPEDQSEGCQMAKASHSENWDIKEDDHSQGFSYTAVHPWEHPYSEPWEHLAPDPTETMSLGLVWRSKNEQQLEHLESGDLDVRTHLEGNGRPRALVNCDGRELWGEPAAVKSSKVTVSPPASGSLILSRGTVLYLLHQETQCSLKL